MMRAQLVALVEARAARRRARIVAALEAVGAAAVIEGDAVRASAPGLAGRWWRDLELPMAGRDGL